MKKHPTKLVKIDPIPILLERAPLPIRYFTAERFLSHDNELVEQLRRDLQFFKPRERLLATQQEDGLWKLNKNYKIEEQQKSMQFLLQLQNMMQLLDYGCTKDMPAIQRGLIAILKYQKPDGKFPLLQHHQGLTLWLLVRYGLAGNPFVEKGFRWLAKRQREDGGWLSPTMLATGESAKTARSGIWTTLVITQAFSAHSRLRNTETCQRAANFLLDVYLQQNHTTLFPEPDAWNHLYIDYSENGLFRGGTLRFLETLTPLPNYHSHPNFKKALDWLIGQQLPSGLWPAIAGRSKEGDYAVTFRVMVVLSEIDRIG
jgi:hypothetical protein